MSIYRRKDSDVWYLNIDVEGHPRIRRSSGTTDKREAQRIHDEIKAGLWATPKSTGRTWGDAVMLWVGAATRSESELLSLRKFARHFKDCALTEVDRDSLQKALAFCKTAGTYNRYRSMIQAVLNRAKDEGWVRDVPQLPTRTNKKVKPRKWLTHEQWEKLYAELPAHMKPMAEFSIETGLRQANVLGLTWDRTDLARKLVWIEGEETKAGKPISVPLSDRALEILEAQKGAHATHVFVFRGRPIKKVKSAFQLACLRAGVGHITKENKYQGFTWHGFRHTWATWHVQNGTPLEVLQKLGAWSDLRMVMTYAHHAPGFVARYANNTRKKT